VIDAIKKYKNRICCNTKNIVIYLINVAMGNSGSRSEDEIVFESPRTEREKAARAERLQKEHEAEAEFRSIEDKIFREGHRRGTEEALARVEGEVMRQAEAALAKTLEDEELRKAGLVNAEAERLSKILYKAPIRTTECQKEELAVLACHPTTGGLSTSTTSSNSHEGASSSSLSRQGGSGGTSGGVSSGGDCRDVFAAYEACAEKVVSKILHHTKA
jgi:hypothetical protein